jgi:GNAT superfamily N-acetyltransferase
MNIKYMAIISLYVLISTSNLLLLSSRDDTEYMKDTCHRIFGGYPLPTNEQQRAHEECGYSRFELYDRVTKKYIADIAYNPSTCFIEYLLVDHQYRKQGVGRELVHRALEELRKHGCEDVYLNSTFDAKPFWKKLGAQPLSNGNHIFAHSSSNSPLLAENSKK